MFLDDTEEFPEAHELKPITTPPPRQLIARMEEFDAEAAIKRYKDRIRREREEDLQAAGGVDVGIHMWMLRTPVSNAVAHWAFCFLTYSCI